MQISDWINVVLSILSFMLAAISVVTVVITLRQNHKMIENATRPYLTIYGAVVNFQNPDYYLVLRNFGQSSATILGFSCSVDLSACVDAQEPSPFGHVVGLSLAPGQAIQTSIDYSKLVELSATPSFTILYSSGKKNYQETASINLPAHADFPIMRANTKDAELKIISYTLQDIAVRQL